MTTASKPLTRTEYLIDRYHVVYETGGGWHCVCAEFRALSECRHSRESEGRRAAQAMIAARVRSVNGVVAGFTHGEHEAGHVSSQPKALRLTR
jgi:hypothetical protein